MPGPSSPARARLRAATVVAAAAVALGLAALPPAADAVQVGVLRPVTDFGPTDSLPLAYDVATLPDGTTMAVWERAAPAALSVRVRAAGATAWGPVRTRALGGAATFYYPPLGDPVSVRPLGANAFLLTWIEVSGSHHVRSVVLPRSPASIPAPATLSGADDMVAYAVATNAAGRAAVAYSTSTTGAVRVAIRSAAGSEWGAPTTISTSATSGLYPVVAVSATGAVTVAWLLGPPALAVVSRTRSAGSWGPTRTLAQAAPAGLGWYSLTAAGPSFVLAQTVPAAGVAPTNSPSPAQANVTRIWSKATATSAWRSQGTFGQPSQLFLAPQALGASDGSAVVTFSRYEASVGSSPASPAGTGTVMFTQRRGPTGAWSAPQLLTSVTVNGIVTEEIDVNPGRAALTDDGTFVSPALWVSAGSPSPAKRSGLLARVGWSGVLDDPRLQARYMPYARSTIAPDGRATLIGELPSGGPIHLGVQSSALPRPYVRSRASLSSTAPRVGVALACTAAWTDAASVTYRWRRGTRTVGGATHAMYRPSAADRGRPLSCLAVGRNASGTTISSSVPRKVR